MIPGALQIASLPHTIRDAISWTSALGERYLWVDCLCVVQDADASAMDRVLKAMGHIYATAELTIVAANGNHANFGLPGFGQLSKLDTRGPTKNTDHDGKVFYYWTWPEVSTWNSRGWTFQEALYSRRLLIFSRKHHIIWLCAQAAWHRLDHQQWSRPEINRIGWHRKYSITMSIKSQQSDLAYLIDWAIAVDAFTRRNLSFEEDFERAFAGAQHGLGSRFPGKMVHGLPQFFFDICLLWLPGREDHQKRRMNHPSWSWTGWTGRSRYKESWWCYLPNHDGMGVLKSNRPRVLRLTAKATYTLEGCEVGMDKWLNGFYYHETYSKSLLNKAQYPEPFSQVAFTALRCETQIAKLDLVYSREDWQLRSNKQTVGAIIQHATEDNLLNFHKQPDSQPIPCDVVAIS
jgi:hypothetical protein